MNAALDPPFAPPRRTRNGSVQLDSEEADGVLKLFGLGREFLSGGRHLLRRGGVLLDHLIELLNRLVYLVSA